MRRFTDLFKSLASPTDDQVETPSFIKANHLAAPAVAPTPPAKAVTPVAAPREVKPLTVSHSAQKTEVPTKNSGNETNTDKIDVPVYKNDSEWDVVQRSINLFADNAHLSNEAKQAFVKKWVTELAKAEQTTLYRNDEGDNSGHLGNEINRSVANSNTGLLGTYQAMIDPGRQARMTDELKALRYVEEFDLGIISVHLSREVKMDLINTVIGTIEEQKTAAQRLIQKAAKAQPEADRIYSSVKALANCREMRLNAAIKTAILKMDSVKYQQLGLQSAESINQIEANALVSPQTTRSEKTELPEDARKEIAKPKVSESDWVDEQAIKLFSNARR